MSDENPAETVTPPLVEETRDGRRPALVGVRSELENKLHQSNARAQEAEQNFKLLVESIRDYAIFMLDPTGRVQTWNVGAERTKGYAASEIIGQSFTRFYPPEDVAAGLPQRLLEQAARDGRVEHEGWRVRKDGSRFWADVVLTALRGRDGKLRGFAKVTRDLTERKRAEDERLRLGQAREAIRLRDEFLSIASHELKTPLTALQLHLESLREELRQSGGALVGKIERATRSSERLGGLIESLLDVARISTGQLVLQPEPLDFGRTVSHVLDLLEQTAERSGCVLTRALEPGVLGHWDVVRLEQVVTNLVGNAFKYAAGTPVHVSLRREGTQAVLEVTDRGPGIPGEDLSRIFGRFERAASQDHYGGLGLGLYVTQEIVAGHGGELSAHNRPEGGATFTARLPLDARPFLRPTTGGKDGAAP